MLGNGKNVQLKNFFKKSQVPAHYNWEYEVRDSYSGNNFGHKESREGYRATGKYYVTLPDGRLQVRMDFLASCKRPSKVPVRLNSRLSLTWLTRTATSPLWSTRELHLNIRRRRSRGGRAAKSSRQWCENAKLFKLF